MAGGRLRHGMSMILESWFEADPGAGPRAPE